MGSEFFFAFFAKITLTPFNGLRSTGAGIQKQRNSFQDSYSPDRSRNSNGCSAAVDPEPHPVEHDPHPLPHPPAAATGCKRLPIARSAAGRETALKEFASAACQRWLVAGIKRRQA